MRTYHVEEVAIVRHNNGNVLVISQKIAEPVGGFGIQVIGGLVHEQNIGRAEQSLRQQHLHAVGACEVGHEGVVQRFGYTQIAE